MGIDILARAMASGKGSGTSTLAVKVDHDTDEISLTKRGEPIADSGATLPKYGLSYDTATGGLTLTKDGQGIHGETVDLPPYGSPLKADTMAQMTDTDKVYVLTTDGHWYYYNGSAWTDGGVYNAVSVVTDKTLTVADTPADAKATGDELYELKTQLLNTDDSVYTYIELALTDGTPGYRLNESDGLCTSNSSYKLRKYAVVAGNVIKVISDDRFQFQNSASVPTSGTSNRVGETYGTGTFVIAVPEGATYLIISTPNTSNSHVYTTESANDRIDILNSVAYKNTGNLLDFGFIGKTWTQGSPGNSNPYQCQTNKISVTPGDTIYATINKSFMSETSALSTYTMNVYVNEYAEDDTLIVSVNMCDSEHQQTGSVTLRNNCSYIIIFLSSGVWANQFTPTILDNAVKAFAYVGYNNISYTDILPNYVPYPAYNESKINNSAEDISNLKTAIGYFEPELSITSGYYLNLSGQPTSAANYGYTQPIPVKKGDVISLKATCQSIWVAAISLCDSAGTFKALAERGEVAEKTYTYYVDSDGYVELSFLLTKPYKFYIINIPKDDVLPSAWETALNQIRVAQGTGLCFGIQTDTHYSTEYPSFVGKQLKEATKYVGFDFVANLGDITRGYTGENYDDTPDNMRESAKVIMKRYTDGIRCPFITCIGNHENNSQYATAHEVDKFTLSELFAQFTKQTLNTSDKFNGITGKSYYYIDLSGVRIIALFTNDSSTGAFNVSSEQVDWFTNTALNTTNPVLILCHVPLVTGWDPDNLNYSSSYEQIMTPLEAFKNNGGVVIACIYGHAHRQEAQKKNGIWHIICTKTEAQYTTAEFFMVDLSTYNIQTIGVGGATSRSFEH